jgi:glyoxylase-like metal-dependent hydrolase (beta-lactamase superfamily II)
MHDGDAVNVAGLSFRALETPGHAGHHMVYVLEDVAFTGDIAGIRLPESGLIELPTPPPEFNLELWLASLDRIASLGLREIYPTHFGPVENVAEHLAEVRALLLETTEFVVERVDAGATRDEIVAQFGDWQRRRADAAGVQLGAYSRHEAINPAAMCVDGIIRYHSKTRA